MKIGVCIKQVPASQQVSLDPVTHRIIRENTRMMLNPADLNALTEAIELKKKMNAQVEVFTMGTESAENVLYTALAMGVDVAYLVTDRAFAGGDSLGTAKVLKGALCKAGPYDLVLCGAWSADGATGQVGPMLAQLLEVPSVTEVKQIGAVGKDAIEVYKAWRGKRVHLKMKLPGVLVISLGSNIPLLPTPQSQRKAKEQPIAVLTNQDLLLDPSEIGFAGAKSIVTSTYLREKTGKHSKMLEGSLQEKAEQVLELIRKAEG